MATFGARRAAMGATIGCPDDESAVFHNPAGLADQPGVRLYLFLSPGFLDPEFRLKALDPELYPAINPVGCGEPDHELCPWPADSEGYYQQTITPTRTFGVQPFLAASTDLGFLGRAGQRAVVSLALYAPNIYAAYLPEDAPTAYSVIGGLMVVGSVTVGAGYRLNRHIALGANISYNYMYLTMSQKLSTQDALTPPGEKPGALAAFAQRQLGDLRLDYAGQDHGVGWGLSLLVHPIPALGLGISYSGSTAARFEGDVQFSGQSDWAREDPTRLKALVSGAGYKLPQGLVVEMPIPHALGLGVHLRLTEWLEAGVEGRLWFYQIYDKQVLRPIYDAEAPGKEPMTEEDLSRDKKYHLSTQLTAGIGVRPAPRRLPGLLLMAGTGYDQSPIPDETFTLDNPSLSHYKASAGVRWQVDAHWRVALSYYLNIFEPRDIRTSETNPPTNVQGRGYSHSPGFEVSYMF